MDNPFKPYGLTDESQKRAFAIEEQIRQLRQEMENLLDPVVENAKQDPKLKMDDLVKMSLSLPRTYFAGGL